MMEHESEHRMPFATPALVIECVKLEVFRDQFGMQACESRGVGPVRRKMGAIGEDPMLAVDGRRISRQDARSATVEAVRDQARHALAGLCKHCPHKRCAMKHWGMG